MKTSSDTKCELLHSTLFLCVTWCPSRTWHQGEKEFAHSQQALQCKLNLHQRFHVWAAQYFARIPRKATACNAVQSMSLQCTLALMQQIFLKSTLNEHMLITRRLNDKWTAMKHGSVRRTSAQTYLINVISAIASIHALPWFYFTLMWRHQRKQGGKLIINAMKVYNNLHSNCWSLECLTWFHLWL